MAYLLASSIGRKTGRLAAWFRSALHATAALVLIASATRTQATPIDRLTIDTPARLGEDDATGQCTDDCRAGAMCCAGDCACGKCWCPQRWKHTTSAWGELVYLQPQGIGLAHAQQVNTGQLGMLDAEFSPGVRLGGSVALNTCNSITASILLLETDSQNTADVSGVNQQVASLVHPTAAGLTASNGPVAADLELSFQIADAMVRHLGYACDDGWINYSAGLGYVGIDQELSQHGAFSGGLVPTRTVSSIDFDGYGPRIGLDGERKIGRGIWTVYSRGNASALHGDIRADYRLLDTTTPATLAQFDWSDDRIVPTLDYELGLAWINRSGRMRVSLGYIGMHFLNMVNTPGFVDAIQSGNYGEVDGSISLEGAVSRVEVRY